MQLAQVRMKHQISKTQCDEMRQEMETLKKLQARQTLSIHDQEKIIDYEKSGKRMFRFVKCIEATNAGKCRVMDYSPKSYTIAISQSSPHNNFMSG